MAYVEYYVESGLAVITLSDSENGNKLNDGSLNELHKFVNNAIADKDVRVILIRSNGENYCLGMDLVFLQQKGKDKQLAENTINLYGDLLLNIFNSPKPVISLINGNVKAGGIGLVAACDIIIASEKSSFELSEVLFGLIPANVLPFIFSMRLTPQKARYIILTAKKLKADEAKSIGMVDEVFSEDKLEKGTKGILKTLFRSSPKAIARTKEFTSSILSKSFKEACDMARKELIELISDNDVIDAVKAFNEGDMPPWFDKARLKKPLVL